MTGEVGRIGRPRPSAFEAIGCVGRAGRCGMGPCHAATAGASPLRLSATVGAVRRDHISCLHCGGWRLFYNRSAIRDIRFRAWGCADVLGPP